MAVHDSMRACCAGMATYFLQSVPPELQEAMLTELRNNIDAMGRAIIDNPSFLSSGGLH